MIRKFTNILKPPIVSPFLKISDSGHAGVLTIDRKESKNTFNYEMIISAYEALKVLEDSNKLVILKSSDEKIFSAGSDFNDIAFSSIERAKDIFRNGYRAFHLIAHYKNPYVAIMSGLMTGGASTFTMSAKYRVVTEKTVFSTPEAKFGFFNYGGASYFLPRIEKNVGFYLGLTGVEVKGLDLLKTGLATHFVDSKILPNLEETLALCDSHDDVQNVLDTFSSMSTNVETLLDEQLMKIEKIFGGLTVEQIFESLKADRSNWSQDVLAKLSLMSPTSLKVCHRSLNLGRHMSLENCARLEWRLAVHFLVDSDIQEGVRAMMNDKDFSPKWKQSSIEDVTDLSRYFGPLPDCEELSFEIKRPIKRFFSNEMIKN